MLLIRFVLFPKSVFLVLCGCIIGLSSNAQTKKLTVQRTHAYTVTALAFSSDQQYILTGSGNNTAKLWKVKSGKTVFTLDKHTSWVSGVAISPNNKLMVTSAGKLVTLWDFKTGEKVRELKGHSEDINTIDISPNGKYLLTASYDAKIIIWNLETGDIVQQLQHSESSVNAAKFSSDSRYVLSSHWKDVVIWEVGTGKKHRVLKGNKDDITSVAFAPNGKLVVVARRDGTATIWDIDAQKVVKVITHTKKMYGNVEVWVAAFSPDGKYLITGGKDSLLKMWEVSSSNLVRTFKGHQENIRSAIFSPDGCFILTGSGDRTAKMWQVDTGKLVQSFQGYKEHINLVNVSSDGRCLVTRVKADTAKLWDIASVKLLHTLPNFKIVTDATFSDRYFAISSWYGLVKLYDRKSGELLNIIKQERLFGKAVISKDNKYLTTGTSQGNFTRWSLQDGGITRYFKAHSESIAHLVLSPNGQLILSGAEDQKVLLWDFNTGKLVHTFLCGYSPSAVGFSPDGKFIVYAEHDKFKVWTTQKQEFVRYFKRKDSWTAEVLTLAIAPDNHTMITGLNQYGSLELWDIRTGKLLKVLKSHQNEVRFIALTGLKDHFISISVDNTVKLWNYKSGELKLTIVSGFDNTPEWFAYTPEGKYDGNPAGLKYLHYVQGLKIESLPQNDPNRVKGLVGKLMKQ